ncbi:type III PLP-dependent enzyme domain-containing protein [Aquiflexum lacus]|uniref:Y4yA family PLP-dependent enzyme n=1 Tax=Aquiflexum lacus TaxID=2483805 RepID=UPI001893C8BF|nr:Y4yA family PLP-dependent enzyme [Aquiflexum lacus]
MSISKTPKLTPIIQPWIKDLTSNIELISGWVARYGSPINLLHLDPFQENFLKYDKVFNRYGLKSSVFFARKANKCKSLVWAAKEFGFGVDTASLNEIKDCIDAGLDPEKITVTAAVKNRELLRYVIEHQIPVVLDNHDECELLHQILIEEDKTLRVGFRLSGFWHDGEKLYSRFGFDVDEVVNYVSENVTGSGKYNRFKYHGLHFHLNGYSPEQRIDALSQTISIADNLSKSGLETSFIDMGGGILMNYLASSTEWETFHQTLRESIQPAKDEITFQKDLLGIINIDGRLRGEPKVYPYYNELFQEKFVEKILTGLKDGIPLYKHLNQRNIELRIEPGRSMLDQVGITIAKVAFRKTDSQGRLLVGLEMNRTQMFSSSADFLLDPIFLPQKPMEKVPCEVYFVGAYCLEQELLLKRKISLRQYPQIGDLVCFVNTAGYMMHFYESEAHLFDLAQNLIVENLNTWEATPDEEFWKNLWIE